jgi:hypothetical protein
MEPFYFSPEALCNHSFKDTDIIDAALTCALSTGLVHLRGKADPNCRRGIPAVIAVVGPTPR